MSAGDVFDSPNVNVSGWNSVDLGAQAEQQLRLGVNVVDSVNATQALLNALQGWSSIYRSQIAPPVFVDWYGPNIAQTIASTQTALAGYINSVGVRQTFLNNVVNAAKTVLNNA